MDNTEMKSEDSVVAETALEIAKALVGGKAKKEHFFTAKQYAKRKRRMQISKASRKANMRKRRGL